MCPGGEQPGRPRLPQQREHRLDTLGPPEVGLHHDVVGQITGNDVAVAFNDGIPVRLDCCDPVAHSFTIAESTAAGHGFDRRYRTC